MTGEWLDSFCAELAAKLRSGEDLMPLGPEKNQLLELARDVAHSTERKNAPLAAYIVGRYVECRVEQGVEVSDAIKEASEIAAELLPKADA